MYIDSLEADIKRAVVNLASDSVYIPFWHGFGGYNNRFSICLGMNAIEAYGRRIEVVHNFINENQKPLHSESLLHYALSRQAIKIFFMSVRAKRVRLGGVIKDESFFIFREMMSVRILFYLLVTRVKYYLTFNSCKG